MNNINIIWSSKRIRWKKNPKKEKKERAYIYILYFNINYFYQFK